MKLTPLRSLLTTTILSLAPLAGAQLPAPVAPETTTPATSLTISPAPKKLRVFESPAGTLKQVLAALQKNLDEQGWERMNVLISPESESAKVPALDLRNVAGSEALSLIASAASCQLDPIYAPGAGNEQTQPIVIVGYKLRFAPLSGRGGGKGSSGIGGMSGPGAMASGGVGMGGRTTAKALDASVSSPGQPGATNRPGDLLSPTPAPTQENAPVPSGSVFLFGSGGGGFGVGYEDGGSGNFTSSPPPVETRVYALASLNASKAFGEVMKTLEDVITTSGLPKEQVKLAFHEKTNVLVVRGPAEAQAIVAQLLAALEKNNAEAMEKQNSGSRQDAATLEVKLQAMAQEMDSLRKRLDESEVERRNLDKLNRQVQDQPPHKSDSK